MRTPGGVGVHAELFAQLREGVLAAQNVEPVHGRQRPVQLAQFDGAHPPGTGVRLGNVVRAVHHALEVDAVAHAEEVG